MTCEPRSIDPTADINEIADEILATQETLSDLFAELMERSEDLGLIDGDADLEEVRDRLDKIVDVAALKRLTIFNVDELIGIDRPSWHEQYAQPQRIHWRRDGDIDVTLITGEQFTENRNESE